METELRRYRSTLRILGTGVIAFAAWAAVKPILLLLMAPTKTADSELFQDLPVSAVMIALLIIILLIGLIIGFRIYLGFSARAEGLGKRKGKAYVILSFILFSIQVLMIISTLIYLIKTGIYGQSFAQTAASLILEISSTVTTGEMAFTAIKVKQLSAELNRTE
jgi:heme/copper-type cytochrome/quinol oxidase subunit 2